MRDTESAPPSPLHALNERIACLSRQETKTLIAVLGLAATALLCGGAVIATLLRLVGSALLAGAFYLLWRKGYANLFGDQDNEMAKTLPDSHCGVGAPRGAK